jgi:hypothetical protein
MMSIMPLLHFPCMPYALAPDLAFRIRDVLVDLTLVLFPSAAE